MAPSSRLHSWNKGPVCVVSQAHTVRAVGRGPQPLARKEQLWGMWGPNRRKGHFWAKQVSLKEGVVFQGLE